MEHPRHKPVTLNDVAKHAGVSPMTVSRVVNQEKNVRKDTLKKVLHSIEILNYRPNLPARALAANKFFKIALLYANPSASYLSELLVGAILEISLYGHQLLVHKVPETYSGTKAKAGLADLIGQYDGIIVPPPLADSKQLRHFLFENDMPTIYLSGLNVNGRSLKICIDDHAAARELTGKLIDLGHRRIGFIQGNPNQHSTLERFRGYKDALKENHIAYEKELVAAALYTYESGHRAASRLLSMDKLPTAIFASNDDMAAATLAVAAANGLNVPDDLSVVGFDDLPLASAIVPRLTTVKQPISEMAAKAVQKMISLIGQSKNITTPVEASTIIVDYEIVLRDSTSMRQ